MCHLNLFFFDLFGLLTIITLVLFWVFKYFPKSRNFYKSLQFPSGIIKGDMMVEGHTKLASVGSLTKGSYVIVDGVACKVVSTATSRPGKHGHAKVRLSAVGLIDEKKRIVVMPGHDNIDVPIIEKKSAQVLSVQEDTANVMDSETYETFDLKIPEELKDEVVEGVNVMYWVILNDKVMKQVKS